MARNQKCVTFRFSFVNILKSLPYKIAIFLPLVQLRVLFNAQLSKVTARPYFGKPNPANLSPRRAKSVFVLPLAGFSGGLLPVRTLHFISGVEFTPQYLVFVLFFLFFQKGALEFFGHNPHILHAFVWFSFCNGFALPSPRVGYHCPPLLF